jgi:hypothetical protein
LTFLSSRYEKDGLSRACSVRRRHWHYTKSKEVSCGSGEQETVDTFGSKCEHASTLERMTSEYVLARPHYLSLIELEHNLKF